MGTDEKAVDTLGFTTMLFCLCTTLSCGHSSCELVQPACVATLSRPTGVPTRPPPGRRATAAPPSATSPAAPTPSRRPARPAERTCHAAAWTATRSSALSWPSSGRRHAARRRRSCVSPARQLGVAQTASWPGPPPPRPRVGNVAMSAGADSALGRGEWKRGLTISGWCGVAVIHRRLGFRILNCIWAGGLPQP